MLSPPVTHKIRSMLLHSLSPNMAFQLIWLLFTALLFIQPGHCAGRASVMEVRGPIGPAISDYLQRGIEKSRQLNAEVIIIRIDTPGGLDHSMRGIIKAILASPVPVITYVSPDGARAASAGTYILYASHLAAMAPATNLGAATPIMIGGIPEKQDSEKDARQEDQPGQDKQSTLERKIVNDASAYIKALAERHGRNSDWAVKAVRESVSLSAAEALEIGVINFIAADNEDLLKQADGAEVQMESGARTISSEGLVFTVIEQSWRTRLLSVISDPNIAYILMLLGIYGLIYELANPGFFLPGVVGGISLLLALYAFQVLPVNYSGLALILLGIILLVAEVFMPSFGSLGIGGIVAFSIGSIILINDDELRIPWNMIAGTVVVSSGLIIWLTSRLIFIRNRKIETGMEGMIGMAGEVIDDFDTEGRVWVLGESWQARCSDALKKGEKVRIIGKEGFVLTIEKDREVN